MLTCTTDGPQAGDVFAIRKQDERHRLTFHIDAMTRESHYATVSQAINELRKKGFTKDFNLEENSLVYHPEKFGHDEFEIVDLYRYEGNSDPSDEATVYAIESKSGIKGILVTGYGISTENMSAAILAKLKMKK